MAGATLMMSGALACGALNALTANDDVYCMTRADLLTSLMLKKVYTASLIYSSQERHFHARHFMI
jgi:hypothetical protein